MIASTLLANGATVYIIGLKQEDLDKWVLVTCLKFTSPYCPCSELHKYIMKLRLRAEGRVVCMG